MILALTTLALTAGALAGTPGEAAPDFTLNDLDGAPVHLADYADKVVVIEWFNPGCPFVVYGHEDGPLKTLAPDIAREDLVYLAINSGAPGKQGHGLDTNKEAAERWAMKHAILVDESGEVGRLYDARTTPQMVIVDRGTVVYNGAIDNAPRGKVKGDYENHVTAALEEMGAGKAVSVPTTKPYGCSVKYDS